MQNHDVPIDMKHETRVFRQLTRYGKLFILEGLFRAAKCNSPLVIGIIVCLTLFSNLLMAQTATGESESQSPSKIDESPSYSLPVVRTDTPTETLKSFLSLAAVQEVAMREYFEVPDWEHATRVRLISGRMIDLIDLSHIPLSAQQSVGVETGSYLLDILGRIPEAALTGAIVSLSEQANSKVLYIPNTPIKITPNPDGSGRFLFDRQTVETAPSFARSIEKRPLRTSLGISSWSHSIRQFAGPAISPKLIASLPPPLKMSVLGTPIWKILLTLLLCFAGGLAIYYWHRLITLNSNESSVLSEWRLALSPAGALLGISLIEHAIQFQINPLGAFSKLIDFSFTVFLYLAFAGLVWISIKAIFETVIHSKRQNPLNLDSNLLRLLGVVVGVTLVVITLAKGAQDLGLPITSILTGLGIGGLAIALAIRPTLENLIGGFVLFLDKPIRVGDRCSFGTFTGTVEKIGVRSIQVRGIDRSQITIPNAQFADMHLVNWSQCDRMVIEQTIGLRYETSGDQLRLVLAQMRKTCHTHPGVDSDTIRIRFSQYGDFALEIGMFVQIYANDLVTYHAIREDLLLRFQDIVREAGTGFAFPSQTLYLARDEGLDDTLAQAATEQMETAREKQVFPFPEFSKDDLRKFENTLDYPPKGSPNFRGKPKI